MKRIVAQSMVYIDKMVSLIIFLTIFVLVFFALLEFYKLYAHFADLTAEKVLYTIALTVVFVKAYRMLRYYMRCHHISVKYIVEISIIAPAVELIFVPENRAFEINVLFAIFSVSMLVVYLLFYTTLTSVDEKWGRSGNEKGK
jgi:uncharacterized membrane protein (DUF373 family)